MSLPSQGRRDRTVRASISGGYVAIDWVLRSRGFGRRVPLFQCRDVLQVWQTNAPSRSEVSETIHRLTERRMIVNVFTGRWRSLFRRR